MPKMVFLAFNYSDKIKERQPMYECQTTSKAELKQPVALYKWIKTP